MAEVLANPDLRTLTRPVAAQPGTTSPGPSFWVRVQATVADLKAAVAAQTTRAVAAVSARCQSAGEAATTAAQTLGTAWRVRRLMLAGLGVGVVAMIHTAPHAIVTTLGAVYAAVATAAVAAWLWVRGRTRRLLPA